MDYPPGFQARIFNVFGPAGRDWLAELPFILERCRARWGLSVCSPSPDMRQNYLEFCRDAAGERYVLKVGPPHPERLCEMEMLSRFAGQGMVRLRGHLAEEGALLLERVEPGTMLWQHGSEEDRTRIVGALLTGLRGPAERALRAQTRTGADIPRFETWFVRALERTRRENRQRHGARLMPARLLQEAERAFEHVLRSAEPDTLLHADLHHENVLLGPTGWMAIDPKGARGPACLEVGRYVQNRLPLEVEARGQALRSRLRLLAEALEEREGVLARVALVDCVLSLCWTLEELELGADYDAGLQTAGLIISMIDDLR